LNPSVFAQPPSFLFPNIQVVPFLLPNSGQGQVGCDLGGSSFVGGIMPNSLRIVLIMTAVGFFIPLNAAMRDSQSGQYFRI
jgi:hypothetical protein